MNVLNLAGIGTPKLTLHQDAAQRRDEYWEKLSQIETVETPDQAQAAAPILRDARGFLREIENGRKRVKAPVLDIGRQIDKLAAGLVSALSTEAGRVGKLIASFQAEEDRKAAEARRVMEEVERKAREEARKKLEEAESDDQKRTAAAEFTAAVAAARQAAVTAAPTFLAGVSKRKVRKFDVTNIQALYKARPDLVQLVPDNARIRDAIKDCDTIDGLKIWDEHTATVR